MLRLPDLQRIEDLQKKNIEQNEKIRLLTEQLDKKKIEEVEAINKEKDTLNDSIVNSILAKFRKIQKKDYLPLKMKVNKL